MVEVPLPGFHGFHERPEVPSEDPRLLHGGEVATGGGSCVGDDVVEFVRHETARRQKDLLGEGGQTGGHLGRDV